jgi:nucleoside-diphosphate-sugar epimerase
MVALLGASGFVGSHLMRGLRERGECVRPVVHRSDSLPNETDRRVADACDVYALRHAFRGCDTVVHAALGSEDVIVGSVAPVYAAAQAVGVRRLVYISTGSVHGQVPAPGSDERSRLTVSHLFPYNTAKVRAERRLLRLRHRGTVELVMLRPTIVFGPGSRWVFDFAWALQDGGAYLVDGGAGICNTIYVDNLAHAVWLSLSAPASKVDGEAILVSDAETVTWRDLYQPIATALGYSLDNVPSVSPPSPAMGWRQKYYQPFKSSDFGKAVLRAVPESAKASLRKIKRTLRGRRLSIDESRGAIVSGGGPPTPGSSENTLPPQRTPQPTAEMIALQRCHWRFPNDKARAALGYTAPVTFEEGCRRSVEWLLEEDRRRRATYRPAGERIAG